MSADNGVYVLKTGINGEHEYRVKQRQAIDNLYWDDEVAEYSDNPDIHIYNAREMFEGCEVFTSEATAMADALAQYNEIMESNFPICEYGITPLTIDRVF